MYTVGMSETHQKKDDCTMPTVPGFQPNSFDMGRTAMLMLTRSMLHSMKAAKQSPTTVQRRCQLEGAAAT